MKVSCLVFLTFTLVLSHQHVNKRGGAGSKEKLQVTPQNTNQALANLMTAGKPIIDTDGSGIVSDACDKKDMIPHFEVEDGGYFCNFGQTTCYATGTVATGEVKVYSKTHIMNLKIASQLAAINVLTGQNFKPYFFISPNLEIRTRSLIRTWLLGPLLPRFSDVT